MKRLVRFFSVGMILWLGCSCSHGPLMTVEIRDPTGVLAWDAARKVDLTELLPYLHRATWTNSRVWWKTSVGVTMNNGVKMEFERLSPMFRIEGVAGTFLIRKEDAPVYSDFLYRHVLLAH